LVEYFTAILRIPRGTGDEWVENPLARFLLTHGRDYRADKTTFKGRRMRAQECFRNATLMGRRDPSLTYVEGFLSFLGVPIHHAWLVRPDGRVVDPTLSNKTVDWDTPYYGVAFGRGFVAAFILRQGRFGLLGGESRESLALMKGETDGWKPVA
jgi:hypothetical protein